VSSDATAKATQIENSRRIADQIDRICGLYETPPRIVVYPTLCLTGTRRADAGVSMDAVAVELPGEEFEAVVQACRRNSCYFVSSTQEKTSLLPGRYFHSGFILGPEGLVLRSPKAQAFSAVGTTPLHAMVEEYESAFGPGSILPTVATELGVLGCILERDLYVPETARVLRSKGAEIIVHPTIEHDAAPHVSPLAMKQTVAFATGTYWLSSTAAGLTGYLADGEWYGGTSSIVGPDGIVDAVLQGRAEGVLVGAIDPDRLRRTRAAQARSNDPVATLFRDLYSDKSP
jgi:predicted amidohydrolase